MQKGCIYNTVTQPGAAHPHPSSQDGCWPINHPYLLGKGPQCHPPSPAPGQVQALRGGQRAESTLGAEVEGT